jgi:hypothetical protein
MAFLKQKMPFMYENFDQLIFFDLNISTKQFSTDGSHEYIKNYSDPDKKITLIEESNLSNVKGFFGAGSSFKQCMFAKGSKYVRDDIDVFWCTDLDEFFNKTLIAKVEKEFENPKVVSVKVPHLLFFKDHRYVYASTNAPYEFRNLPWPRIRRHKPGNIYPHCGAESIPLLKGECLFHFSVVGRKRLAVKMGHRQCNPFINVFDKFNNMDLNIKPEEVKYIGQVHGDYKELGLKLNTTPLPDYIDLNQMLTDLGVVI